MTIQIALPVPPSINRLWRAGKHGFYISDEYDAWSKQADLAFMAAFAKGARPQKIVGPFEAIITIANTSKADLDNIAFKATLDWAQRVELISNDKNARKLTAQWGDAPSGCLLTITESKGEET